ncbi:MAG: hypothetical protein RLY78_259 [Pseudomonadota bacterium]
MTRDGPSAPTRGPQAHGLPPPPELPCDADHHVGLDLDIALRTPQTLVVHAHVSAVPEIGGPRAALAPLGLVIPRHQCRGDRPRLSALRAAAQDALARAVAGRRLAGLALDASRLSVLTAAGGHTWRIA